MLAPFPSPTNTSTRWLSKEATNELFMLALVILMAAATVPLQAQTEVDAAASGDNPEVDCRL